MRTLLNAPKVSATLYRFADWLQGTQAPASQTVQKRGEASQVKVIALRPSAKALTPLAARERTPLSQRPLRVLRIVDSQGRAGGGRTLDFQPHWAHRSGRRFWFRLDADRLCP